MKKLLFNSLIISAIFSQTTLELSLNDALSFAEKNNLTVKKAHNDFEKSIAQKKEARSSAYPVISAFAQGTKNLSIASQPMQFPVPFGVLDDQGNPVATQFNPNLQETATILVPVDLQFGQDNTLVYGFSITQPLFDGRVLAALRSADTYEDLAWSGLHSQIEVVLEQTTTQYYTVLVMKHVLDVMNTSLELSRRHLEDAQALYSIGTLSELSVIQAEVQVANAETMVSQAQKNLEITQIMLKRTCGIELNTTLDLTDKLETIDTRLPPFEELSSMLIKNQPVLRQLDATQKLMKENILLKRAEFMPSLALTGSYSQQRPYNDGAFNDSDFREASSIGLSLSYPIFNGFGSKARLKQAKADYQNSQYTYMDTENALLMELSQLYYSARESIDRIDAGLKQVELAIKAADMAESLYQKGMNTELEYQDAVNGLHQAELGLAQAYLEYHIAVAGITRSTGFGKK